MRHTPKPVRTFTIGSANAGYDEAGYAKSIAKHLGTDHTELYVGPEAALAVIQDLPKIFTEPFGDSSQIPTYLVSKLASAGVRVSLSGDGGDEVFGGYNRYLTAHQAWIKANRLPASVRQIASRVMRKLSPDTWDSVFAGVHPVLPHKMRVANPGDKLHKLAKVMQATDGPSYYRMLTSHWDDPATIVIGADEPDTLVTDTSALRATVSFESWMMAMDTVTYLPDDILVKVDRAAMANSLETRVPFLDHRVVELAWRMPFDFKIRNGEGKWILRQILDRHVPRKLIERPKMGFGVPLGEWLRGPLREWAEDLLGETRLHNEGYFYPEPIRAMWEEHLGGKTNWQHHLWTILMFQAWLESQARD